MTDTSTKYDNYDLNDIYAEVDNPDDPEVLLGIAHHYRDGNGVEKNQELYLSYLNKAADAGNEKAIAERNEAASESSENATAPAPEPLKNSNQNIPLTGNESVSELINMADAGNSYASLELLKQAYSLSNPDQGMIRKYGKMLDDYIHNGEADVAKADIACQTGDLYTQHNEQAKARIFYDAAREYGSNEAAIKLIPILCKEGKADTAYEAYRNLHQISDTDRVQLLKLIAGTLVEQKQSPLLVKGICEELACNPAATEEDKKYATFLTTLVSEGWDGIFRQAGDPYYAEQLKHHFNNVNEINKLTEEQFGKLMLVLREGDQAYLLRFLSYCIAYGNTNIRQYIYNSTPEFSNGTLYNYLMADPESRFKTNNYNYREAIQTYKLRQRAYYNSHLSELMNDPANYEKIKEFYSDPEVLGQSVDYFQTLLDYFRNHKDKEAVIQLLGNGLCTTNDELYQTVIKTREFKNGELNDFMSNNSARGNVSKARSYYDSKHSNYFYFLKEYIKEHISAKIFIAIVLLLFGYNVVSGVAGSIKKSIKPLDYVTVSFSGTNGYAKTSVSLDYDALSSAAGQEVTKEDVSVKTPSDTSIKNGDHVTVRLKVDDRDLEDKKLQIKSGNLQKSFRVTGLKKGTPVDPFKDIKITEKGGNGYGHIVVKNTSDDPFLGTVTYKVKNNKNLSNGATVQIKVKADVDTVNLYGEYPSKTETTYKLSNLGTYPTDINQINADDIRDLANDFTSNHENVEKIKAIAAGDHEDPVLTHAYLISNHGKKINAPFGTGFTDDRDVLVLVYYISNFYFDNDDSVAFAYPNITIDENGNIKPDSVDFDFDSRKGPSSYESLKNWDSLMESNSFSEKEFK